MVENKCHIPAGEAGSSSQLRNSYGILFQSSITIRIICPVLSSRSAGQEPISVVHLAFSLCGRGGGTATNHPGSKGPASNNPVSKGLAPKVQRRKVRDTKRNGMLHLSKYFYSVESMGEGGGGIGQEHNYLVYNAGI